MGTDLASLTEELRHILDLFDEEEDPKATAQRAAAFAQKAAAKGNRRGVSFWKGVLSRAQAKLRTAAGKNGHDKEPEPPPPAAGPKDVRARLHAFGASVKGAASAAADKLKNAPAAVKRLVTDPKYRKEEGKKVAAEIKKVAAKAVLHAVEEVAEVVKAGAVLTKVASGKKLTHEDKHVLKQGAKALVTTLIGTIAIGGIGHLTAHALATHFALETAAKSAAKAALYAELTTETEKKAMLRAWAEEIVEGVRKGFESLEDLDPDELSELLSAVHEPDEGSN